MRQDNTYEGEELLKALDLPIEGESVKRRRLPDYKTLQFFDYEHCFSHYAKCIMNIKLIILTKLVNGGIEIDNI